MAEYLAEQFFRRIIWPKMLFAEIHLVEFSMLNAQMADTALAE